MNTIFRDFSIDNMPLLNHNVGSILRENLLNLYLKNPKDPEENDALKQIGIYTLIPMFLLSGPLMGFLIGKWIDQKMNSEPWAVVVLSLLGFVAGVRQSIEQINKLSNQK